MSRRHRSPEDPSLLRYIQIGGEIWKPSRPALLADISVNTVVECDRQLSRNPSGRLKNLVPYLLMMPMEIGLSLIFDALSNSTRRQIILILVERQRAGYVQMMREAGLDPASKTGSFSYHLSRLRESGLLRRSGGGYSLTQLGIEASGLLHAMNQQANPCSKGNQGGKDLEIVEMGKEDLSELAHAIYEREDAKSAKSNKRVRQGWGVDVTKQIQIWTKMTQHLVYGTLNPTPDRKDLPDPWVFRALSIVAKRDGRIISSLFASEYPAKNIPAWGGWGIQFERSDRPTQTEKLLSGDVAGMIGRIWVDPNEDHDTVQEVLVKHILTLFKKRNARFVEIERRFSTKRELEWFETSMNRLGMKTTGKDERIMMSATF